MTVEIKGFEELERNLKKLDQKQMKSVFRSSSTAAGRVIVKAARNNLAGNYKTLKKSLTSKPRRQKNPNEFVVSVGPTVGKNAKYNGWYGHIVERGSLSHKIPNDKTRNLKNRKEKKVQKFDGRYASVTVHPGTKAYPFMRPAIDNNLSAVIEAYKIKMDQGIKKKLA